MKPERCFTEDDTRMRIECSECGVSMWVAPCRVMIYRFCGAECNRINSTRQKEIKKPGWYEARFTKDPNKDSVNCQICNISMWLPTSKVNDFLRCSRACNVIFRTNIKEARRRPCETCGTDFIPRSGQISLGQGRFCSTKCNTISLAAFSTPEAQARAVNTMRLMRLAGLVKNVSGENNPAWKGGGGPQAWRRRRQESGLTKLATRAYRRDNPDKVREQGQRRKDRKLGKLPRGTVKRIGALQKWRCAICRVNIRGTKFHTDHIIPLALGGLHVPRNIQLLCAPCNVRKQAKDPIDYMRSLGRLL